MDWPDYGQLSQWLMLFGQNIAVGMIAVIAYAALGDAFDGRRQAVKSMLIGVLFGCGAIVSMMFPFHIAPGVILDTRNVFILVGSLSADPLGALIVTLLPAAYRLYLGGAGAAFGLVGILAAGLIGFVVQWHYRDRVRDFGIAQFALVGAFDGLVSIGLAHSVFALPGLSPFLAAPEIALLLIFPVGTALLGSAMSMTYYRAWRRARRRLVDILETASDLIWETDAAERFTFVSDRYRKILGFEPAEIVGRTADSLGGRWLDEATRAAHMSALAAHEPFGELTYIPATKDGSRKLLSISGRPHLDPGGQFLGYRGTAVEITDRERWRALIATISGRVGDRVGEDFLRSLTRSVAEALEADWAFLSRYDADRKSFRSVARYAHGAFIPNHTVPVADIPARELLNGSSLVIPSGLMQRYPRFAEITGVKAEAYGGTPLIGAKGDVLGVLAVGFRGPVSTDGVEPVLRVFAGRAAAEMERATIEDELRRSRDGLVRAQGLGRIGSAEVDLQTGKAMWSEEQFRIYGRAPDRPVPDFEQYLQAVHPDDRDLVREARRLEESGQGSLPIEFRIRRPDGEERWIHREAGVEYDESGKPAVLFATHQDITEREKMRRLMAEVLAALDVARDGVILTDDQRRIVYANGAAIDLLGLPGPLAELEGKRLSAFQPTAAFGDLAEAILAALRDRGEWHGSGTWIRPSDGNPLHFDARVHRLPNDGVVMVLGNAEARLRVEMEERRRQEWQAQASKLEALGNLAGGIAHDFNNLLGAILGFGQFLVEDLEPNTEPRHFAERIVAVSQRGRSLVQQILSFSRRSPVETAEVYLADAIDEAHELLRATLPATTHTILDVQAEDAMILGDRGQIVQVLVNLCVNGSDALGGGPGQIAIAIRETEPNRPELARLPSGEGRTSPAGVEVWSTPDGTGWMATGTMPPGPCVSITVTDSGAGIPETVRRQIFEPFFTTKDRGRGTGLGLAVVQRIVIEHGGAILVKTQPGVGTSFELILPAIEAKKGSQAAVGGMPDAADKDMSRTSILVVDDDESFCAMVDTALRRSGYRVQSTNDPRVAMAWVKRHAETWDILVTDQTMPFVKGEELVRYFKAHSPDTRSIICTGYSSDMTEQRARAAGAEALLLKPFEFERLAALVSRLAHESSAGNA